ncbi:Uncharacterised protein [Helicobacter pametensis]|nr:Uncharacterised protein [Helicobacter pametensis]
MGRYLLISYDLKKPGRDYSGLANVIKVIGGISTIHLLESAWLVSTTLSIQRSHNQAESSNRFQRQHCHC